MRRLSARPKRHLEQLEAGNAALKAATLQDDGTTIANLQELRQPAAEPAAEAAPSA
jgi:hypothetical protein